MTGPTAGSLDGLVIVLAGATGPAGTATAKALTAAGATVVAVGRNPARLAAALHGIPGIRSEVGDLGSQDDTSAMAGRVRAELGRIDGVVYLVGGWRGGRRFTDNTDEDWQVLSGALVDGLRHVTIAVHDDLVTSPAGRAVIVSATAVRDPHPGAAGYAAAKAAAETWLLALAESLRRNQSGRRVDPPLQHSAAVILVVNALVDAGMRAAEPGKSFDTFTDVEDLAARITDLFRGDADQLNGARIEL